MKSNQTFSSTNRIVLTRADLITFEQTLKEEIERFCSFTSHNIFFPPERESAQENHPPGYSSHSKELVLPLILDDQLFGVFVAQGVKIDKSSSLLESLVLHCTLILEKLRLIKQKTTDPLTGLYNFGYFQDVVAGGVRQVGEFLISDSSDSSGASSSPSSPSSSIYGAAGGFTLIVLNLDKFQHINDKYGYLEGDRIISAIAQELWRVAGRQSVLSRIGYDVFALYLSEYRLKAVTKLCDVLLETIRSLSFEDSTYGHKITVTASGGAIRYPMEFNGQHRRHPDEQSRSLIRMAEIAVAAAKFQGRDKLFFWRDILRRGGKVLEMLPMRRMAVSLGRKIGAKEGQRFLIHGPVSTSQAHVNLSGDASLSGSYPSMYKAEVVLVEVQQDMAFAELLHQADPDWAIDVGDAMSLISDKETMLDFDEQDHDGTYEPVATTGLYTFRDFEGLWKQHSSVDNELAQGVIRILDYPIQINCDFRTFMDRQIKRVFELVLQSTIGVTLAGRYGLNGAVFLFSGSDAEKAGQKLREVSELAFKRYGLKLGVGVAGYPCLDYSRGQIPENARKALEHALLLPDDEMKVTVFNSDALNVSADTLYSEGDVYGAIEEFKQALLLDKENALALNSLGVCYAQLNKFGDARTHFQKATELESDDLMFHYNLGWASYSLGEIEQARKCWERCLELDSRHSYTLIRLGGLAEQDGEIDKAKEYYTSAADVSGHGGLPMRHLARIALNEGEMGTARDYLQRALALNGHDGRALFLLAQIYFRNGEDLEIVESLVRNAAALLPDIIEHWELLAEVLRKMGRDEDAEEILYHHT
ncbi:MAG: tetratricopeptide repeat protein [Desulfovibrio sp.]